MKIVVNGETLESRPGVTLAEVLAAMKSLPGRFATTVNGDVVSADRRAMTALNEGDRVEILTFAGGG